MKIANLRNYKRAYVVFNLNLLVMFLLLPWVAVLLMMLSLAIPLLGFFGYLGVCFALLPIWAGRWDECGLQGGHYPNYVFYNSNSILLIPVLVWAITGILFAMMAKNIKRTSLLVVAAIMSILAVTLAMNLGLAICGFIVYLEFP